MPSFNIDNYKSDFLMCRAGTKEKSVIHNAKIIKTNLSNLSNRELYRKVSGYNFQMLTAEVGYEGIREILQEISNRYCDSKHISRIPIYLDTHEDKQHVGSYRSFQHKILIYEDLSRFMENEYDVDVLAGGLLSTLFHELTHYRRYETMDHYFKFGELPEDTNGYDKLVILDMYLSNWLYGIKVALEKDNDNQYKYIINKINSEDSPYPYYHSIYEIDANIHSHQIVKKLYDNRYISGSVAGILITEGFSENANYSIDALKALNSIKLNEKYTNALNILSEITTDKNVIKDVTNLLCQIDFNKVEAVANKKFIQKHNDYENMANGTYKQKPIEICM